MERNFEDSQMTTGSGRTEQQDELEMLVLELSEVKGVLRELSQQILRIERRAKAALPPSNQPKQASSLRRHMDVNAARRIIGRLTEHAKNGEPIERELRQMSVKGELCALARELGMTNTKLPPKDELVRRISSRLRQRAAVAVGIQGSAPNMTSTGVST